MKKWFAFFSLLFIANIAIAQQDTLLHWQTRLLKINDSTFSLSAKTSIPKSWHVYAANKNIEGLESIQFVFDYQNIHPSGEITFNHSPQIITDKVFDNKQANVFTDSVQALQVFTISSKIPSFLTGSITANIGGNKEFQTSEQKFSIPITNNNIEDKNTISISSIDINHPINTCGKEDSSSAFLLGLLGGIIALLTPCVFPMVPVTVSFFTKRSGNRKKAIRNGLLYGFFIFLLYVLVSLPFHLLSNIKAETFNNIATNVWLNIVFFLVFIVFAISFFGYFEITLPSAIAGKTDAKSGLTSIGGIFFMAVTLTIVSFSCTGPILGSLLVAGSMSGGAWQLTEGLAGFGLALALPFGLFAIFPNWLHSLPKSGGWLDTVKKVLAFIELALAFKFLSNADLVMHGNILKREVFIGIWILIGIGLTAYLFGKLRLPHDEKGAKISTGRKALGILSLAFTLYLIPGVTQTHYANLKLLSGLLPPLHYSVYGEKNINGKGIEANVMNDYNKALQLAKAQHKPILIDFTGWACTNCRRMEEQVWTDPDVYTYIKDNFILVSLYVDDRQNLPAEEQVFNYMTKEKTAKDIITIGDKWATFESENFHQTSQPLYAIIDTAQQLLNTPVAYTPDARKYRAWLQCGNEAFLKRKK